MYLRRCIALIAFFFAISFFAWLLPRVLNPVPPNPEKRREDNAWVNSSPYWLDRQACRWLSLCGVHHLKFDAPTRPSRDDKGDELRRLELRALEFDADARAESWETAPRSRKRTKRREESKVLKSIPAFVLDHAPLVHLCSEENFWPSDIAEHIRHMTPNLANDDERLNLTEPLTLHNMHLLNNHSSSVYLVSDDDVETRPEWLYYHDGIPMPSDDDDDHDDFNPRKPEQHTQLPDEVQWVSDGTTWYDVNRDRPLQRIADPRRLAFQSISRSRSRSRQHYTSLPSRKHHKPDTDGYSKAPAVLILVDKGSGILDAFWFFFYSYNLGQTVLNIRFGNHVGDWEHTMIRFENGIPRGVFFSEHEGGQAYAWPAVEKRHDRPVLYSAVGSHAMYAMPGIQAYILPFKLLKDVTDRGPLWDPAKNVLAYHYDYALPDPEDPALEPENLVPAEENPGAPTSWFHYAGSWGDKVFSLADERQWRLFGQYHYVTGPRGPKFKRLEREKLCPKPRCTILHSLEPGTTWYG